MSERSEYLNGIPCWSDLAAPDMDGAKKFYGGLFGWESGGVEGSPEETGGYDIFTLRGKNIAGFGPPQGGEPPAWRSYIKEDDVDAKAKAAAEAGAQLLLEPMDVMAAGRTAVFADPTGAVCGIWQPKEHTGAELVNEPGAMCWNELLTRDTGAAEAFYTTVFGWTADTNPNIGPADGEYTQFKLGDDLAAGMMAMPANVPGEVPANWMTYFAVEDADATAAMAKDLGGSMMGDPFDVPTIGRIAMVADPSGAVFGVTALAN